MRLHRVRLKDYRGVDDCAVAFPSDGVTVIEGDNEVGKTCIPEAVNLILSEMDSSGKRTVKAIRPVHRDAGPEVEVEISSGDYRFTYFKRWHRQPETTLEVTAPQREQLTGREAHHRVEEILEETLDQDLWKALAIEQGVEPGLPKLSVPSLGQALDLAAGSSQSVSQDDDLWERICAERLRYWTNTGKETQERKSLTASIDEAQNKIGELKNRLQAIDGAAKEAAQLADGEGDLINRRNDAGNAERELSEQWNVTESLRAHVDRLSADHIAAQAQHGNIAGDSRRRQELIDAVKARRGELSTLEAVVDQAAPELALAVRHSSDAASALKAARDALRAAEDELRLANNDRDYHRNLIESDQLSERYERVIAAQESLKKAEAVLDSSQVTNELVSEIEQANLNVASAKVALGASVASVEATALSAVSALVDGEEVKLEADAVRQADVIGNWELVVPDVIRVRVQAGTESHELAANLEATQLVHDRLCAQGGVGSLAEARQKAEERKEAERQREDAVKTIKRDLRDLLPEVLAQKVEGLAKRIASYPGSRPESPPLPSNFDDAKQVASNAETSSAECRAEVARCEENHQRADDARQQAELSAAVQSEKLNNARDALEQAERRLEEDRLTRSDDDLGEALAVAQKKVEDACAAMETAEHEFQAHDPESIKAKLDNARNVKAKMESDLRNNQERQHQLRGTLEAHGETGLHSQLNKASSEHQHLRREQERTEARAQAARLLYETFEQRRQEAHQRYIEPFKRQIEGLGRIVFGPTFEVVLDADLRVTRRTLDGITLDIGQLSVGAREQLGVICRLACAVIVSPDGGGAPVVIDDALGWSDPSRLQAMGAAIAAAGRECQVIVLTCTPGRYAHVGNAEVVRLPT